MDTELMQAVEATNSRKEKTKLLTGADDFTQRFLKYALDPYMTFGLHLEQGLLTTLGAMDDSDAILFGEVASAPATVMQKADWWQSLGFFCDRLACRELSGAKASEAALELFRSAPSIEDATWGLRVVNKDLRCGVSQSTLLKALPGIINPFTVSLAKPYDAEKHTLGPGFVEPKLDGLRMVVVDGIAYTRNGRVLQNVEHILRSLGSLLKDWVFDGEVLDPDVSFEETISKARGGSKQSGLEYHVFDVVDRESWFTRDTLEFKDRRKDLVYLASLFSDIEDTSPVKLVPSTFIEKPTLGELMSWRDNYLQMGYEGAMFKIANAPYQFKRSNALLKIKKFETLDARIVDVTEGAGKHEGKMGALVVELEDGEKFNVGTGYSDEQREEFWATRDELIDRVVEVKYQNKTNHGKARFPVFVRFRFDKE